MDKAILSHAPGPTASIAPRSNGLVLRRKCGCEGSCNDCQKKNELPVRTKLRMSEPGDAQEREADDVANRLAPRALMRDEVGNIDGSGIADAVLAPLPRSQTKLADHLPGSYGTGSPLSPVMRSSIEPLLGYDLSTVRIFPKEADHVAADINARAFTLGHDIYFRDGEYRPDRPEGMRVLLHELTHTTQPDVDGGMLLQRTPSINSWDFRNSGSVAPDNCATAAPGARLGEDTAFYGAGSFTNGMEVQVMINNDEPGAIYDIKRTKERAAWQLVGGTWRLFGTYQPPGTDDDRSQDDECLTPIVRAPRLPYIYSFDEPGFNTTASLSASATEAVYKANFLEFVEITTLTGGSTSANTFAWHSITWLTKAGGSWAFDPARSEIAAGTTTVGSAGP